MYAGPVDFMVICKEMDMAKKKMCEICGANPATVPDRERIGRSINRVCGSCHAARLRGDMVHIMECHKRRREMASKIGLGSR